MFVRVAGWGGDVAHDQLYTRLRSISAILSIPRHRAALLSTLQQLLCAVSPRHFYFIHFPSQYCVCRLPHWPTSSTTTRRPNRGHIGGGGLDPLLRYMPMMFLSRVGSALPPSSTVKSMLVTPTIALLSGLSSGTNKHEHSWAVYNCTFGRVAPIAYVPSCVSLAARQQSSDHCCVVD